eukprot:361455-Chlamydomonas_euryale.AAC.2
MLASLTGLVQHIKSQQDRALGADPRSRTTQHWEGSRPKKQDHAALGGEQTQEAGACSIEKPHLRKEAERQVAEFTTHKA